MCAVFVVVVLAYSVDHLDRSWISAYHVVLWELLIVTLYHVLSLIKSILIDRSVNQQTLNNHAHTFFLFIQSNINCIAYGLCSFIHNFRKFICTQYKLQSFYFFSHYYNNCMHNIIIFNKFAIHACYENNNFTLANLVKIIKSRYKKKIQCYISMLN